MKLQDQVCKADQADRLKELGVDQDALFYHTHSDKWGVMPKKSIDFNGNPSAAYTVAELGVLLPDENGMLAFSSYYSDHFGEWQCECRKLEEWDGEGMPPILHETEGDTEAEARAAMLIYLLENNLITAEQVNARLKG